MRLVYILLVLALVLNPAGCAWVGCASRPAVQDENANIEQQEEKKVTVGTWFKFIGYLCLFGLFSPSAPTETEYITEVDGKNGVYEPQRKYKKEKGR
jgi:hypothetical protein